MLKKTVLGLVTLATFVTLAGCAAKKTTKITGNGNGGGQVEKGVAQKPVLSDDEQFAVLFSELQWNRHGSFYSLNVPSASSVKGCVEYRVAPMLKKILTTTYACARTSDDSDTLAKSRFELTGEMTFTKSSEAVLYSGVLLSKTVDLNSNTTTALSRLTRQFKLSDSSTVASTPLNASTVFDAEGTTTYVAEPAADSGRSGEEWKSEFNGAFYSVDTNPTLTLIAGSSLTLNYRPEVPKSSAPRREQQIQLVAQTDVPFISTGGCLRPIGTFEWKIGTGLSARKGTIVSDANGFSRNDGGGASYPWGARCLER